LTLSSSSKLSTPSEFLSRILKLATQRCTSAAGGRRADFPSWLEICLEGPAPEN
jgi:hypothetical protein